MQCGLGRTGKWFVYQHAGFLPDVVPLAKGLASGVPVGACVVGGRAKGVFKPGNHGSTFGGNPLAMTAVVTTIDTIKEEGLLANAARVGDVIRGGLSADRRGSAEHARHGPDDRRRARRGPAASWSSEALDAGLVINVTADNVVRLLPPLIMTEAEGQMVVERLAPLLRAFLERASQPKAAAH